MSDVLTIFLVLLLVAGGGFVWIGKKYNQADWGHTVTNILDGWIRLYCRKFHRQALSEITLPNEPKLLLVANHISGIDPFILITALKKPVRFMIAKEEYHKPILHFMFKAAGCIPVDRGGRVDGAFRAALRAIEAGELVALFPQGGIHAHHTPREVIKPGMVRLSELANCPILAIRIQGVGAPGTILNSIFVRGRVSLEVHALIRPEQTRLEHFRKHMAHWLLHKRSHIF